MPNRQTLHHNIYIITRPQTDKQTLHHVIYISSSSSPARMGGGQRQRARRKREWDSHHSEEQVCPLSCLSPSLFEYFGEFFWTLRSRWPNSSPCSFCCPMSSICLIFLTASSIQGVLTMITSLILRVDLVHTASTASTSNKTG